MITNRNRPPIASLLLSLLPFVCPPAAARAEDAPAPAPARETDCKGPLHHQFEFWSGEWEVRTPAGDLAGTSRIEPILAGCALLENWSGSKGGNGKSLNFYDRKTKEWNQVWMDESGGALRLTGGLRGADMVLQGRQPGSAGAIERITWTPLPDGRVRQLWESSTDDGATWSVQFDGLYARRAKP
jgi:hypothetical protein